MKKRKLRGFTLIECLIAMAIMGVASVLLVQAYSSLLRVTNMNDKISVSIAEQMKYVEAKVDNNAGNTGAPVEGISGSLITSISEPYTPGKGQPLTIEKYEKNGSSYQHDKTYLINVNVYCVTPRSIDAYSGINDFEDTSGDNGTEVRYIYFHR